MKPKIRFKELEGEWRKEKAGNIFKTFNEKNCPDLPVLSATQDKGMVPRDSIGYNIFHDKSNEATYKHILPGQFVIHLRSFQGGFAHSSVEGITSPAYTILDFKNKEENHDYFWKYIFSSKEFVRRLELITYGIRDGRSINFDEFAEMTFLAPSKEEQQKVADYFKTLDRQIALQIRRLEKLKQIKAASLQSMFPQEGETTPRIRFKGFEGEWPPHPLKEFARKMIEKNTTRLYNETFTNSAEFGVISQRDFFDHDISNDDNISGYYVIHSDDFVYNPRISVTAPVGPINRNLLNRVGVMSPLYFIFRVEGVDKDYLGYFFKTTLWHKYMLIHGNAGARFDRLSIADDKFLNMPIILPKDISEQQKIADYFKTLDRQITLQTRRLEKLKQIKAACLDKMFV